MVPAKLKLSNFTSYGEGVPELDFTKFHMAAISGLNGAGKSSLLDILAYKENPDDGTLSIKRDLQIAYLQQSPELNESKKIIDEVFSADIQLVSVIREYEECLLSGTPELLQEMI